MRIQVSFYSDFTLFTLAVERYAKLESSDNLKKGDKSDDENISSLNLDNFRDFLSFYVRY